MGNTPHEQVQADGAKASEGASVAPGEQPQPEKAVYGLLGRTLAHAYSPRIHKLLGGYDYRLFEVEPEDVETFVRSGSFAGINVTVPYKETVMPFCDKPDRCGKNHWLREHYRARARRRASGRQHRLLRIFPLA